MLSGQSREKLVETLRCERVDRFVNHRSCYSSISFRTECQPGLWSNGAADAPERATCYWRLYFTNFEEHLV